MKTVIFDTECNGMRDEAICQLSAIIVDNGHTTAFNRYFAVHTMSDYAIRVHGLSKMRLYDLSKGETFEDWALQNIHIILGADIYVGHNAAQDIHVLQKNLKRVGIDTGKMRVFCTMKHFDAALHLKGNGNKTKPPRLEELCEYYRITQEMIEKRCKDLFGAGRYHAHDARYDSTATLLCILEAQKTGDLKGVIE